MSAFFSSVGSWIMKKIVHAFLEWLSGKIKRDVERRQDQKEQEKKDEANKPKYDEAVKNGTEQQIEEATEDYLNGK